jgi:hypothetical protein
VKRNKRKGKRGEKGKVIYSFYLLSQKEKRRKKERNDPFFSLQNERKMEKEREEIRGLQGHEKEKDLVHHGDEQGLKLVRSACAITWR